jgi:hypothetical protein
MAEPDDDLPPGDPELDRKGADEPDSADRSEQDATGEGEGEDDGRRTDSSLGSTYRSRFGVDPAVIRALNTRIAAGWQKQVDEVLRAGVARFTDDQNRQMQEIARTAFSPDLAPLFNDIAAMAAAQIDVSGVLAAQTVAQNFFASLPKIDLSQIVESYKRWIPPNWSDDVDYDVLESILNEDGLPTVWVPSAAVLDAMVSADSRAERVLILLDHADALLDDGRVLLNEVTHDGFSAQIPLAVAVLDAWAAGHHAPAQALAVAVTEHAVTRLIAEDRSYRDVAQDVRLNIDYVPVTELRLRAALAPLAVFYAPRWVADGEPGDTPLSRHLTVHQADAAHYTIGNALVAVLLMVSILRSLQDYQVDLDEWAEQQEHQPVDHTDLTSLAAWSEWVPLATAIHSAPSAPGVYLIRDGDRVVYAGVASARDRAGNAGTIGLRARFANYVSGRLAQSTVGEVLFTRALADRVWLKSRLDAVVAGFPQTARQWAQDAVAVSGVQVAWSPMPDRQQAETLRCQVIAALGPTGLEWQQP